MKRRLISPLLALVLTVSLMPASTYAAAIPKLHRTAKEMAKLNSDTVGWLQVPGTDIDEVVVQNNDPDDHNNFYYRRNFNKEYSFDGCYYADFRCKFPPDSTLGKHTVIYGHSMSDDPDGVRFAQLYRYRDKKFAAKNPVIYFSTTEKTMAWQVFAVSVMTTQDPYNVPTLSAAERMKVVERVRESSIYAYADIEVTEKDRILTLSTMDYSVSPHYPNEYRFVVMAKRVDPEDLVG